MNLSSESDLLDGELWSDDPWDQGIECKARSQKSNIRAKTSAVSASSLEKPNYAGVRKYVAHMLEELRQEYPEALDKELRAIAIRRWHEITEIERRGKSWQLYKC